MSLRKRIQSFLELPYRIEELEKTIYFLSKKVGNTMAALDNLTVSVSNLETGVAAAVALFGDLKQYVDDHGTDPAVVADLQARIDKVTADLAASVANTPVPAPVV